MCYADNMSREDELDKRLQEMITTLARDFHDLGDGLKWTLARTLIHRAIHFATEKNPVEFCALATYLSEMIGHAHKLAHGDSPKAHQNFVH